MPQKSISIMRLAWGGSPLLGGLARYIGLGSSFFGITAFGCGSGVGFGGAQRVRVVESRAIEVS